MAVTIQFMTRRIKVSGEAFKNLKILLGIQIESRVSDLLKEGFVRLGVVVKVSKRLIH